MSPAEDLREIINLELNKLAPIVEIYGGLDPFVIVDLLSERLDLPYQTVEAAFREEASKRAISLVRTSC